jgi:gliding motility-associated-like protein
MRIVLIICLLISPLFIKAQYLEFVENKGQHDNVVKFNAQLYNGAFFLHNNGYTVLQHNVDDVKALSDKAHDKEINNQDSKVIVRSHAVTMKFIDAKASTMVQEQLLPTYNNYFIGNDASKYATHCNVSNAVLAKNVYPNIDVRYFTSGSTLKYDLIVQPGANLNNLKWQYTGANDVTINKKGTITIKTSVGDIQEYIPQAYYTDDAGTKQTVSCKFKMNNDIVSFSIGNYDRKKTLTIDPVLIFGTYTGSTVDNWGFTATYGPAGEGYGGGIAFGSGFPVSTGAFQTSYGGGDGFGGLGNGFDAVIIKYSANGSNRLYATYLGGSSDEQPHSLIADNTGLVIAGRTASTNFPTTSNAGPGGGWDIFLTKLSAAGDAIIGSIKIGGSGADGQNIGDDVGSLFRNYADDARSEVIIDQQGNIVLSSCTRSTNFPVTAGALQATNSGLQDAVFIKASNNLSSILYATYFGGMGDDAAYVVTQDASGSYYFAGGTNSSNLPEVIAGVYQNSFQGGNCDGFITVINNNATAITRTSYFGTAGDEQIYGIQLDRDGDVYFGGTTTGSWPVINATFSNTGAKQFITKTQNTLSSFIYSTTFGSNSSLPNITPTAFLVDNCENVYFSGWGGTLAENTNGTSGMPVTPDAIRSTTNGDDFYFFVLEKDAARQLYGSFFGVRGKRNHVDGGTSRFDKTGTIYQAICADCSTPSTGFGPNNFTTAGAWATVKPASVNCNLGFAKIAFQFAGVNVGVKSSIGSSDNDSIGCVPLTVDFRDTSLTALSYEWNFGDGTGNFTSTAPRFSHTYNNVGQYRVRLVAFDPTACIKEDTSYITIIVRNDAAALDFNPVKIPPCTNFEYEFQNLSTPPTLFKPFSNNSFSWDFGDGSPRVNAGVSPPVRHTYAMPGVYTVKMFLQDTNYCNVPDSVVKTVRVSPIIKADFAIQDVCVGDPVIINNKSVGGLTFTWNWGNGDISTGDSPTYTFPNPGQYTVTLTASDPNSCNLQDIITKTVNVLAVPTALFSYSPLPSQVNIPTQFTNQSTNAIRYTWFFGDGDTTNATNPGHQYIKTGIYDVALVAYNTLGCRDTFRLQVEALINPLIDVPSAFSPNGDGVNEKVIPKSFGVEKQRFIIWNRWGQKVFETTQRNVGWDGYFKGKLQPQDAYAYTLEVTFSDGQVVKKSGDITLFR